MTPKSPELTTNLLSIHAIMICIIIFNIRLTYGFHSAKSEPDCIMYNFGDSNTDIGSSAVLVGLELNPPYGQHFYQESVGRFSDGRVYLDYICEELGRDYLSPYPEPLGSNFSKGAGFAIGGATTLELEGTPFSLRTQVEQFAHLQKRSQKFRYGGKGPLISEEDLKNALYLMDIGQNDFHKKIVTNWSLQTIIDKIPLSIDAIAKGIQGLYVYAGARKFWISNTGPLGCLPLYMTTAKIHNITKLDKFGCVYTYNLVAKNFNNQLRMLCDRLRLKYKDANIVYVDMYKIKHALFAKPKKYGFQNPLTQCCFSCSLPWGSVCPNSSKSVVWDDVHLTEAAHKVIASKTLSGNYSTPRMTLQTLCKSRIN